MTERNIAHRRKNPIDDQLLELLLTGESGTIGEGLAVVAERRDPRTATVVVLAPGDGMEVPCPGCTVLFVASEFSSTVARNLTILGNGSRLYHSSRKAKLLMPDVDESWATILTKPSWFAPWSK